jgi:hypothetical protein
MIDATAVVHLQRPINVLRSFAPQVVSNSAKTPSIFRKHLPAAVLVGPRRLPQGDCIRAPSDDVLQVADAPGQAVDAGDHEQAHTDPTSPTSAAVRDLNETLGLTQKSIAVDQIMAQSAQEESDAAYLRSAAKTAGSPGSSELVQPCLGQWAKGWRLWASPRQSCRSITIRAS